MVLIRMGHREKLEKCGVMAVFSKTGRNVAPLIHQGLVALQHRGHDAAGISVSDGKTIVTKKGTGLVADVFSETDLEVEGPMGIGHTRYRTVGLSRDCDIQPFTNETIAIAHNGQIVNYEELKAEFEGKGHEFLSSVDSELILHLIKEKAANGIEDAIRILMTVMDGAYSAVAIVGDRIIAFRDKYALRPLAYGETEDFICFASETCALDVIGVRPTGDVGGGELITVDSAGFQRKWIEKPDPHHCMFEYVYFARPNSVINGLSVYQTRLKLGEILAEEQPVNADVVIPVPETSRVAAHAFASKLGIPLEDGLLRNRFVFRTFIMPTQRERDNAVRLKFSPVQSIVQGRRVAIIDDSIVRGTTTKEIVKMVREAGAREIHLRVTCPQIVAPCFYGIDMSTYEELIAKQKTLEEIRTYLGADSLGYLSIDGLKKSIGLPLCTGCLDEGYPTKHARRLAGERKGK